MELVSLAVMWRTKFNVNRVNNVTPPIRAHHFVDPVVDLWTKDREEFRSRTDNMVAR
jgi:hypothetical protein